MAGGQVNHPIERISYPRGGEDLVFMCGRKWGGRTQRKGVLPLLVLVTSLTGVSNSTSVSLCSIQQIHQMTSHNSALCLSSLHFPAQTHKHTHWHTIRGCTPASISSTLNLGLLSLAVYLSGRDFSKSSVWDTDIWHSPRQIPVFVSHFTSIQGLQSSPNVFLMKTASSHRSVSV